MRHLTYTPPSSYLFNDSGQFHLHYQRLNRRLSPNWNLSRLSAFVVTVILVALIDETSLGFIGVEARAPHIVHPDPIPPFLPPEPTAGLEVDTGIPYMPQVAFNSNGPNLNPNTNAEQPSTRVDRMPYDSHSPAPSSISSSSHSSVSLYNIIATVPNTRHNTNYSSSLYPFPPSSLGLHLEQVHVYARHGERTPVSLRLDKGPQPVEKRWRMCFGRGKLPPDGGEGGEPTVNGLHENKPVNGKVKETEKKVNGKHVEVVTEDEDHYDNAGIGKGVQIEGRDGSVLDGECLLGELTDIGRQSTYNLGLYLREVYISKFHLLPPKLLPEERSSVYFRSTFLPRTIESMQHIVQGLYPPSTCHHDNLPDFPQILIRNTPDETLFPNARTCRSLETLLTRFASEAAEKCNPILAQYDDLLGEHIGREGKIRVDGKPRASGVMDTVRAALANGVDVPEVFKDEAITDVVDGAVVEEWFGGYRTHEVCKLGIGPLLNEMLKKMKCHIVTEEQSREPKLLVHSTHDTAVAAVLQGLDVFDNRWPPFTASLSFELYSKRTPEPSKGLSAERSDNSESERPEYYIRLLYQSAPLALPFCSEEGKHLDGHPEFCRFDVFQSKIEEWDMTPEEWEEACRGSPSVMKSSASPISTMACIQV